jgi:hypothetical protein
MIVLRAIAFFLCTLPGNTAAIGAADFAQPLRPPAMPLAVCFMVFAS